MEFLVIAAILALAAGFWFSSNGGAKPIGTTALLTYGDSSETLRIPLDTDKTYDVDTGYYTIHLQVKDGRIAFVDSPCPDHTCESFGWLNREGQWAACLPAKAMLTIETE
jgi:hypothetical protein